MILLLISWLQVPESAGLRDTESPTGGGSRPGREAEPGVEKPRLALQAMEGWKPTRIGGEKKAAITTFCAAQ